MTPDKNGCGPSEGASEPSIHIMVARTDVGEAAGLLALPCTVVKNIILGLGIQGKHVPPVRIPNTMKEAIIIFVILLLLLVIISTFGGSVRYGVSPTPHHAPGVPLFPGAYEQFANSPGTAGVNTIVRNARRAVGPSVVARTETFYAGPPSSVLPAPESKGPKQVAPQVHGPAERPPAPEAFTGDLPTMNPAAGGQVEAFFSGEMAEF